MGWDDSQRQTNNKNNNWVAGNESALTSARSVITFLMSDLDIWGYLWAQSPDLSRTDLVLSPKPTIFSDSIDWVRNPNLNI